MMSHAPLVSVIIPCYNHGRLLQEAINSVRQQSYTNFEIIIVDDGSVDHTKEVAQQNPEVNYLFQTNQGLSAARNTGIRQSKGELLVFLDADDYLYKDALAINLDFIGKNELLAFVSGSHDKVYTDSGRVQPVVKTVPSDHYIHLLKGNYIGMHATVMYRRWVFDDILYDTSLKACEDYDLYLKVARKHQVLHHANRIAAYRLHGSNMSNNLPLMLTSAIKVIKRQKNLLLNASEVSAYAEGLKLWKAYYIQELSSKLQTEESFSVHEYLTLLKYDPGMTVKKALLHTKVVLLYQLIRRTSSNKTRKKLRSFLPDFSSPSPVQGKIDFGDFQRLIPFSTQSGSDRGGPVDQYYIKNFLGNEALSIKGSVLEVGNNAYTLYYGGDKVTKSDILNLDESNAAAVEKIVNYLHLPENTFDCIILTQALHLIYNFKETLHICYRILKPGGTLLLTVPGITPISYGEREKTYYWSFTDRSIQRLMKETFPGSSAEVYAYGNVFTATAFLYGMGLPEIPLNKLMQDDPHYQVIITAKATKGPSN